GAPPGAFAVPAPFRSCLGEREAAAVPRNGSPSRLVDLDAAGAARYGRSRPPGRSRDAVGPPRYSRPAVAASPYHAFTWSHPPQMGTDPDGHSRPTGQD